MSVGSYKSRSAYINGGESTRVSRFSRFDRSFRPSPSKMSSINEEVCLQLPDGTLLFNLNSVGSRKNVFVRLLNNAIKINPLS